MQVEIFEDTNILSLAIEINKFLEGMKEVTVIDMKFTSHTYGGRSVYAVLVMYEEIVKEQ